MTTYYNSMPPDDLPPFCRLMYVNDWSGTMDSKEDIDKIVNDAVYMNVDALMFIIWSDYFEAVKNPEYSSWDSRASWNMVEYAVSKAHEKNIQMHVWIPINYVNSLNRAEGRLFGDGYRVIYRDGTVNPYRYDLAFDDLFDYELGLLKFIAEHYPQIDGIQLEEPYYQGKSWKNYASYTTAMRERIKVKYGYDPLDKPEAEMIPLIHSEMRIVLTSFFTEAKNVVKTANPKLQLSANGPHYNYRGLSLTDVNNNYLFDWYAAQIYRTNTEGTNGFKECTEKLVLTLSNIPAASIAGITYSAIYPETNPEFPIQIEKVYEFGADMGGVFTYNHANKIIKDTGKTAKQWLYEIIPDCTSTIEENKIFSLVGKWYFDEVSGTVLKDESGYGSDGIIMDGYATIENNELLNITDSIIIKATIMPNMIGEGGPNAGVVAKSEALVDWSWQLRYSAPDGYMGFQFNDIIKGSTWVSVKQNLIPGKKYQIEAIFDGSNVRCYLDGIETDKNIMSAITVGNSNLFIGQDGWNNIFNGTVYEVEIYHSLVIPTVINMIFSPDEIKDNMEWSAIATIENRNSFDIENVQIVFYYSETPDDIFYTIENVSIPALSSINIETMFEALSAGTYNVCCKVV